MKKIFAVIAIMAMFAFSFSAFAMTPVADSDLSTVTGQSGVSINLDVRVDLVADTIAWGDADGFVGYANTQEAGWVGLSDLTINNLRIRADQNLLTQAFMQLVACGGGANPAACANYAALSARFVPLTIDVATDGNGQIYAEGTTFVRIGLGSLQIELDSLTSDVVLGSASNTMPHVLGSIYLSGLYLTVEGKPSYVDIYAKDWQTGGQGVGISLNVEIPTFTLDTVAWGDADGYLHDPAWYAGEMYADYGGWVGLKDLAIAGITINGTVGIDVATDASDWTFVQIGLDNLTVGMGSLTATAALGQDVVATGLDQELGGIYISGLNLVVNGDVQIGARSDNTQGVTINMSQLSIDITNDLTISWGDADGIGAGTTAGYVGLTNLNIGNLAINGPVTIDVATIDPNTALITSVNTMMYAAYSTHFLSPSFVHIGLGQSTNVGAAALVNGVLQAGSLGISIASLAADVTFANINSLDSANARSIGSLYVGGLNVGVNGWVDIAAH